MTLRAKAENLLVILQFLNKERHEVEVEELPDGWVRVKS
jgi:hypothetical protein